MDIEVTASTLTSGVILLTPLKPLSEHVSAGNPKTTPRCWRSREHWKIPGLERENMNIPTKSQMKQEMACWSHTLMEPETNFRNYIGDTQALRDEELRKWKAKGATRGEATTNNNGGVLELNLTKMPREIKLNVPGPIKENGSLSPDPLYVANVVVPPKLNGDGSLTIRLRIDIL